MSDPPTVRPDPDHFAKSLERWHENREWLTALALELGWNAERTLGLGRVWLDRFVPAWDDPPHTVKRRAELCAVFGLPVPATPPEPPEAKPRPYPKNRRPRPMPLTRDRIDAIGRASGTLLEIAARFRVGRSTVARARARAKLNRERISHNPRHVYKIIAGYARIKYPRGE